MLGWVGSEKNSWLWMEKGVYLCDVGDVESQKVGARGRSMWRLIYGLIPSRRSRPTGRKRHT